MRCVQCKKMVPSTSVKCPYCGGEVSENVVVEPEIKYEEPKDNSSKKLSLLSDPKMKMYVYIGIGVVVFFVLLIFIALLSGGSSSSSGDYKSFAKILDNFEEFLQDNYFSNSYQGSGDFDFYIKYNKDVNEFAGRYGYDLKNKVLSLTASIKDPGENKGSIIVDYKKFDSNIYYDKGELYYNSKQLFDDTILFKFNDDTGIISSAKYDMSTLVESISDALKVALKEMDYHTTKEEVRFLGDSKTFNKLYFVLDNQGKKKFLTAFYDSLADDSSFVNEVAKMRGEKADDVEKTIRNYSTSAEYKYSGKGGNESVVSLYTKNGKPVRLEFVDNETSKEKIYRIDLNDQKYHFYYFVNSNLEFEVSMLILSEEINEVTHKTYEMTIDSRKFNIDINLDLKLDNRISIDTKSKMTGINYTELTDEQIEGIKDKLKEFVKNYGFIDKFKDIFIDRCSLATDCVCKDETCNCLYESKVIVCPNKEEQKGEEKEDTVSEDEINKTTTTTTTSNTITSSTTTTTQ